MQEIKNGAAVSGRGGPEVLPWLFWEDRQGGEQLGHVGKKCKPTRIKRFTIFLDILFRIIGSVPSLPENMLVLDIAGRKWSGALSIEQAWQGVGEGDEEREDINFHEGGVQGLCLHQR